MANGSYDNIPMDDHPEEETPYEDETSVINKRGGGGKRILGRIFFMLLILTLIIAGFVLWQKSILDLEAQAQVNAARTATAKAGITLLTHTPAVLTATPTAEVTVMPETTATAVPPTAIVDSNLIHTATIAAQLTEAAH